MILYKWVPARHWVKCTLLFSGMFHIILTHAQGPKVHWGITALPAAKLPFLPADNHVYSIWGNVGLGIAAVVEGEEENTMSLSLKAGFGLDFTRYKIPVARTFAVDRGSFFFNPEVLFPTGKERLKIAAGFGVEFNGYFLAQMAIDSGSITQEEARKIEDAKRKGLAFLSAGLQYDLNNAFVLQVGLKQMLMDVFRGETTISYQGTQGEELAKLNQIPTYLGVGITYFFGDK